MMIADMPTNDHQTLKQVARELRDLAEVEFVYLEPLYIPDPEDIPPETPDLVALQDYRGPDPGIDIDYAWTQSASGGGIRISDVETAWNFDHEDLNDVDIHQEPGQTHTPDWDPGHGTAVLGEITSAVNAYGCSGMTPDVAGIYTYSRYTIQGGWRPVAAVTNAINDSGAGDIVLLEMQTIGADNFSYVPAEYDMPIWVVVKVGTDAGVIVVAAAGNGNQDLDIPAYQEYMNRGDSGAIIVGAGSADTSHDTLEFSTYGARVDLQGWGERVFTLGWDGNYAEYGGDPNQRYTDFFTGTSSASPFVACAAVAVQSLWESFSGSRMTPAEMRAHLIATGIPQGSGGHIGPLPNLRDAINELPGYNEPPVAVCEDLVLVADVNGQAFATADDVGGGSYDPDDDDFVIEMEPAGPFLPGDTEVTITVTDEHGTFDSCTATITVDDVTAVEEAGVPRAAGIVGVVPNPFNPMTTVSFYVPEGGHVDLAVYDISGRMVAQLVNTSVAAGEHSVQWTGTDTRRSRVASGVYFFRMRAGSVVDVKRGILVE